MCHYLMLTKIKLLKATNYHEINEELMLQNVLKLIRCTKMSIILCHLEAFLSFKSRMINIDVKIQFIDQILRGSLKIK